jgi:periplasmic copper chaperone A
MLLSGCGPDPRAPEIAISHGWTREIAPGQTSAAVYVTIANRGDGADRLVDVNASAGAAATPHSSSNVGGVARMRAIEGGIEVPAHATVELKPGGTHIMMTGLKQRLSAGQTVDLNLRFARSGQRPIAIRVVPADDAPAEHGMIM